MRVKFNRDYTGQAGEQSYLKGAVVDLDEGVAQRVITEGAARAFPRSTAEVAEQAAKYYPGDDKRTPAQIADRIPQVVALAGDTRTDVEEQTGEDDPHEFRKKAVEATAGVADKKASEKAADEKDAERAAADKRAADEKAAAAKRGT